MRVRAKFTIRNEAVIRAREKRGWNQRELAEAAGVSLREVQAIEWLDFSIKTAEETIIKIATVIGVPTDDICQEDVLGEKIPSSFVATKHVDLRRVLDFKDATNRRLLLPSPEECTESQNELNNKAVDQALSFLTTRQREVIGLRFGVGKNSEALTQKEVGKELGLSQGRIQQIETAAFRNLQNPMRSTKIYQTFSGEILEQK